MHYKCLYNLNSLSLINAFIFAVHRTLVLCILFFFFSFISATHFFYLYFFFQRVKEKKNEHLQNRCEQRKKKSAKKCRDRCNAHNTFSTFYFRSFSFGVCALKKKTQNFLSSFFLARIDLRSISLLFHQSPLLLYIIYLSHFFSQFASRSHF
jgi:hypothetical protein